MPFHGHTPGHTGYLVSSGNETVLIWGDIVHVAEVQFARPDAALTFDLDPEAARRELDLAGCRDHHDRGREARGERMQEPAQSSRPKCATALFSLARW